MIKTLINLVRVFFVQMFCLKVCKECFKKEPPMKIGGP
jgi:hypothetical protein